VPNRRREVLRILTDSEEPLGLAEIAEQLGVHTNTVRFHIDSLVESGQVRRVEPARGVPGRPAQLFSAVRRMSPDSPRQFRMLAGMLARGLAGLPDGSRRARDAGVATGHELAGASGGADATEALVDFLDGLGFEPERKDSEIRLHACPFLELAERDPTLVCQAHLGLMRGALRRWDADVRVTGLTPFVQPDLCVARLQTGARK